LAGKLFLLLSVISVEFTKARRALIEIAPDAIRDILEVAKITPERVECDLTTINIY
jgi:hypothetical protein